MMDKEKIIESLIKIGFVRDHCYLYYNISDCKYFRFYPFEMRLQEFYHGIDEWNSHKIVTEVIFQCGEIWSIEDLNMCFHLCKVDLKVE